MTLDKNSFFVRAAYLWYNKADVPTRTNLCSLFWRTVLTVALPILAVGLVVSWVIVLMLQDLWAFLAVVLTIVVTFFVLATTVALIFGIGSVADYFERELDLAKNYPDYKPKFPVAVYLAVKRNYCPIVEIK